MNMTEGPKMRRALAQIERRNMTELGSIPADSESDDGEPPAISDVPTPPISLSKNKQRTIYTDVEPVKRNVKKLRRQLDA